jgi:hypothetical protein
MYNIKDAITYFCNYWRLMLTSGFKDMELYTYIYIYMIVCVCVCSISLNLWVAKYICRYLIVATGNFPTHNVFCEFSIDILTSVVHYKKQTPSSGSNSGSEFRAFCGTKLNYHPKWTGRRTILITPYLAVDFNSACHLHLVLTTHLPQSNFYIHSQHALLRNTLNTYRFSPRYTVADKHTSFKVLR